MSDNKGPRRTQQGLRISFEMGCLWTGVVGLRVAGSGQIWFLFELELSDFAEGIHVGYEGKGGIQDDCSVFSQSNWKNGAVIY